MNAPTFFEQSIILENENENFKDIRLPCIDFTV